RIARLYTYDVRLQEAMATETEMAEGASSRLGRVASRLPLSRERIVDSAMDLVERHGLPGLTTRRLGAALGCEAMSIYHHFPSKQHLLDALVERAIEGGAQPPPGADPIERLRFIGHEYRRIAHRHPRLFPLLALHETSGYAEGPQAAEPVGDDYIAAECPRLTAAAPYFKRPYFDSTFELGFESILKGIAESREALRARACAA